MPLVTTEKMLKDAQNGHYAVGAFNVENMEMVMAVMEAAEELKSPVIMQTSTSTAGYAGYDYFCNLVKTAAARATVPISIHLDHGNSFDAAMTAYRAGYTSIMIDGSKLPFDDNVALTKKVTDATAATHVPVEAELGRVGGKEGDEDMGEANEYYTEVDEAKEFVEKTGVDSLAVAIGTTHGIYKGTPHVNMERISELAEALDVPLVMHGTSGVPDEQVREAVKRGICKVNYATDLRLAFTEGVKEYLAANPDVYDPKKYSGLGKEKVKAYVKQKMDVVGSVGKAG